MTTRRKNSVKNRDCYGLFSSVIFDFDVIDSISKARK